MGEIIRMKKRVQYRLALLAFSAMLMIGCAKETEEAASGETQNTSTVSMEEVLPQAGEAAGVIAQKGTETEAVEEIAATTEEDKKTGAKKNKKASGTITVATVVSPNVDILKQATLLLEEKGYQLKVEVCEDYLTPNQMVMDGTVDCNYYQHEAFLERYNIEHTTTLAEVAKIHYEPLVIYSEKLDSLEKVEKGMKVAISNNPTAIARSLWLLQDVKLLTLMSDADMNTVKDDIAENPYNLEFVFVEEAELVGKLQEADLVICDKDLLMQKAMDGRDLFLAQEKEDSMMVQNLSQVVVAADAGNEKAAALADVLLSEEMRQYVDMKYQGSICMMANEVEEVVEDTEKVDPQVLLSRK